jgi:hypothetical protein
MYSYLCHDVRETLHTDTEICIVTMKWLTLHCLLSDSTLSYSKSSLLLSVHLAREFYGILNFIIKNVLIPCKENVTLGIRFLYNFFVPKLEVSIDRPRFILLCMICSDSVI